jgi:hypothetical protein
MDTTVEREAWERISRPYLAHLGSVADIPGFTESLRILLVEERYTLTDVAYMFGVSRERVRQWAKRLGLAHGHHARRRVWVEAEQRFRPVGDDELPAVMRPYAEARQEKRRAEALAPRRAAILAAGARLYADLGRPVMLKELAALLRPEWAPVESHVLLCSLWYGGGRYVRGIGAEVRAALAAAGVPVAGRSEYRQRRINGQYDKTTRISPRALF